FRAARRSPAVSSGSIAGLTAGSFGAFGCAFAFAMSPPFSEVGWPRRGTRPATDWGLRGEVRHALEHARDDVGSGVETDLLLASEARLVGVPTGAGLIGHVHAVRLPG